ncbi:MAG: hypothetical protein C4524_05940 [Candidatus Zixiibacteriota bacterium]|nr:MAG: hypothetical protein C4524_05940 [candidate division Zixibacteria bacterium]
MRTLILSLLALAFASGAYAQNPLTLVGQYDGEAAEDYFGGTLTCGDFNADGYDDFIIGAWGWNNITGKVYFYAGGAQFPQTPLWTISGHQENEGYAVCANIGDVSGDGIEDFAVAANTYELLIETSRLDLYFGGIPLDTLPDFTIYSAYHNTNDFWYIDSCGDVNGDGGKDIAVLHKAYGYPNLAHIYWGGAALDTVPDWTCWADQSYWINGLGDVNGDGYADIMIRQYQGPAAIYFGGSPMDTLPDVVFDNGTSSIGSGIRDLNGDGYNDVAFCWFFPQQLGYDVIHWGGPDMDSQHDALLMTWANDTSSSGYGLSCGDFNGDGYGDIVGTGLESGYQAVRIWLGGHHPTAQCDATIYGNPYKDFGYSLATGDIDHDGCDELLIAEKAWDFNPEGAVYLFDGPQTWIDYGDTVDVASGAIPSPAAFTLHPPHPNPFNPATTLRFDLPQAGYVRLEGFDTAGRKVSAVGFGEPDLRWYPAGTHEVTFDGAGLPSGVYLVRMEVGTSPRCARWYC